MDVEALKRKNYVKEAAQHIKKNMDLNDIICQSGKVSERRKR